MASVGRSETKVVLRAEAAEVRAVEMTWGKKLGRLGIVASVAEGTKQQLIEKSFGCAVVSKRPLGSEEMGMG